jgi:microcystin-dependent protein
MPQVTDGQKPVHEALNAAFGAYPALAAATPPPAGVMRWSPLASAPTGWLLADGAAVSRTVYAALFAVIGTTWGAGDGTTTFNLPDLRGRAAMGAGTGVSLTARTLAGQVGTETHQLSITEMASHFHVELDTGPGLAGAGQSAYANGASTGSTGNDQPHNNMQPSLVLTPIIKT